MAKNDWPHGLRLVSKSEGEPRLGHAAFARLEEGRAMLVEAGHAESVQLLDIVLLQLRAALHDVSAAELKALCDALTEPAVADDRLRGA